MSIDDQELRAIAFLTLRVRKATPGAGPWDEHGLMANLRKLQSRNLHMTVEHVLRHAADPKAKSPGVILGSFTPDAPSTAGPPSPPKAHEACRDCGRHVGGCLCEDGPKPVSGPRSVCGDPRVFVDRVRVAGGFRPKYEEAK